MRDLSFFSPLWLWLLVLPPALAALRHLYLSRGSRALPFPVSAVLASAGGRSRWYPWTGTALGLLALACLTAALARPVRSLGNAKVTTEGVAILICMDISGSMLAEDFQPNNRMDVARTVVADFAGRRAEDRLGLVTFAALPLLRCPLTTDHETLLRLVRDIKTVSRTDIDGTAIGDALVASGKRLIHAPERSKVVILVTDGENNRGQIDPGQAAELLAKHKIRVDVVGIGSQGVVPYPVAEPTGKVSYQYVHIGFNEESLKAIAATTDGVYFNATDKQGLEKVFKAINALERSKITATGYVRREELFVYPLGAGAFMLILLALWRLGPGGALP